MAIIKCLECKREISNRASCCPGCGYPVSIREIEYEKKKEIEKWERAKVNLKQFNSRLKTCKDLYLNDDLKKEVRNRIIEISEKKKLKVIAELLEKNKEIKPELACFTPEEDNKVILGNGTQLYRLEDINLPFKVCFTKEYNAAKRMNYISENDIKEYDGLYPSFSNIFKDCHVVDIIKVNTREILTNIEALKHSDDTTYFIKSNYYGAIAFNYTFLENAIDILKLPDYFYIEITDDDFIVIENLNGEKAIITLIKF